MNQKSFDLRMQEIRLQYVKESHEIERLNAMQELAKSMEEVSNEKDNV